MIPDKDAVVEDDIYELGCVDVLRHVVELSQQKNFSQQLSTVVRAREGVQNKLDCHRLTRRLLGCLHHLPKRALADLLLDDVIVLKLVPWIHFKLICL